MKGDIFEMTDKITHISKVIIEKLWGYSDLGSRILLTDKFFFYNIKKGEKS